jgi:hypothetical protein
MNNFQFCEICGYKKSYYKKKFSPLSFAAVFWIRNPGWVKIRIRDKHPGSETTVPYKDLKERYGTYFVTMVKIQFLKSDHLIRIRIQHFRLNTDPDPDPTRIQGFLTKN